MSAADAADRKRCFVILPFAAEFDDVFYYGIQSPLRSNGYIIERADEQTSTGPLLLEIIRRMATADLVIADLSQPNPNIYYELGIAHSVGVPVILIAQKLSTLAFDVRGQQVIVYSSVKELEHRIIQAIRDIDSPSAPSSVRKSPVLEAVPSLDRVPRSELQAAQSELSSLRQRLAQREGELETLKRSGDDIQQFAALRSDIKSYLQSLTGEFLDRQMGELASAKAEIERLKAENQQLSRLQLEVRRFQEMVLVNPRWPARGVAVEPDLCFLLMPFREAWSDDVWKLISGIVTGCGLRCRRADEQEGQLVMNDIWEGLCRARVVIADLTAKNPNVTYEVGLADVLGKDVILVSQSANDVPFDFLGVRLLTYENSIGGARKLTEELGKRLARFGAPRELPN